MKKIVFLIIFSLIFMPFATVGNTSFAADNAIEQGKTDGAETGQAEGELAGKMDFEAGKKSSSTDALPTDAQITVKYSLLNDNSTYRSSFINSFRTAFIDSYKKAYRRAALDAASSDPGTEGGETLGASYGTREAMTDYNRGLTNNPERSYREFLKKADLVSRFNLIKETKEYINTFEKAFSAAYKKAYSDAFRSRNVNFEKTNSATYELTLEGKTVSMNWPIYNSIDGAVSEESNLECTLEFESGSAYAPTNINVSGIQHSFSRNNYKYIPVSSVFKISTWGLTEEVTFRKPVKLQFNFYGSENVGIYKWQNNRWEYMYTNLSDGMIETVLSANKDIDGEYAILIDENARPVMDSIRHWARKEIYTFARRNYIDSKNLFRPDAKITRADLAQLLYLNFSDRYGRAVPRYYADVPSNSDYYAAVNFVVNNHLMTLDEKGRFRPNEGVRYWHMEMVYYSFMHRTISWRDVADQILREKFARTGALNSRENYMTRAEAVYFILEKMN